MTVEEAHFRISNVYTNLVQKDSQAAEPYKIAIKALEKQIALKPLKIERERKIHILCSQCNYTFYILIDGEIIPRNSSPYCRRCGQRIDWEEEKTDV